MLKGPLPGLLPPYQKDLKILGEEPGAEGETGDKTSAPTTQKGN
jgi:hypothetical protein